MNTPWGYRPRNQREEPQWDLHLQTHAIRSGLARSGFGETSEALYLNSGFTGTATEMGGDFRAC